MLLVYLPKISSRIQYVFELLFMQEWKIEYQVTSNVQTFEEHQFEKINYSASRINDEFFIKASSLLSENFIEEKNIIVEKKHETTILFPNDEPCDLGFDIFSAIFYMVSRYEEYLPYSPDIYGRYKAVDSISFQNNFLQKPLVNIWSRIFENILQKKFPSFKIKSSTFNPVVTYDIDVAYKFKGRNFYRTVGATAKDLLELKIKNILERIKTLLNFKKDSWDVYDSLLEVIAKNKLESIFFFLLADKTANDRNLNHNNPLMKRLINDIKNISKIGIHPSFTTSEFPEKMVIEKIRLEKISGINITKSRQHYLKFNLPTTYNSLLAAGITEDYSMGFPDMPGFRAGTCKPFYFYDLKNEKATRLKIFPVTCMEGSFINSNTQPEQAFQQILNLINEINKVNGIFISIWHNHTLSESAEYKPWKKVHDQMIEAVLQKDSGQLIHKMN